MKRYLTMLLAGALALGIALPAAGQGILALASETTNDNGTIRVETPTGGDGGWIWKTANDTNRVDAFTIDLGEEKTLPADFDELYLAIKLGGERNPSDYQALSVTFALEDEAGNAWRTDYTKSGGHEESEKHNNQNVIYAIPAVLGGTQVGSLQIGNCFKVCFRTPDNMQAPDDTTLFIPFASMIRDRSGTFEKLEKVRYFSMATYTNLGRWQEFKKISLCTLDGLEPIPVAASRTTTNNAWLDGGFEGFKKTDDNTAATAEETLAAIGNELVIADFSSLATTEEVEMYFQSNAEFSTGNSGTFRQLARTYVTSANYKKDYQYFITAQGAGKLGNSMEKKSLDDIIEVNLNASMTDSLAVEQNKSNPGTTHGTDGDKSAPNYDSDYYAYIQLWAGEPIDVSQSDGFALKLAGLTANTAFRISLFDEDGTRYSFMQGGSSALPTVQNFVTEAGENVGINNSSYCVWANSTYGAGTLYYPYADMVKQTAAFNGQPAVTSGEARIQNIARVMLSYDNSADTNLTNVLSRGLCVGIMADVKAYDEQKLTKIFDTAEYTWATDAADTEKDVNPLNPLNGKQVKPENYGNDEAVADKYRQPLNWKNELFVLRKTEPADVATRSGISQKEIGDVRIVEDFSLGNTETSGFTAEQKSKMIAKFLNIGTTAPSTTEWKDNTALGFGDGATWVIGDYESEYVSGDLFSRFTFTPSAANDFSTLKYKEKQPKGVTVYIENLNDVVFNFNIETLLNHATGKMDRWSVYAACTRIYYYDVATGREFNSMTVNSTAGQIAIGVPVGFKGWIRVPFTELTEPNWIFNNTNYDAKSFIDFDTDTVNSILFNAHMTQNSNLRVVVDNLGFYYSDFSVGSSFHSNPAQRSIKACLADTSFFND